jgi:hypothetical protein
MNMRTDIPSVEVTVLNSLTVVSVCNRSFAYACHVARSNSKDLRMLFSLFVDNKSSKTGRAHYM